ncbi:hypothetical protein WISP_26719 [Willisornis vidua]|uniref:ATR-interacting protein n=1 Tax=Willisornis vidua TaxID=1566151 RepID=A0ABQ9DPB7_9PASS|nr:hypothetical protein WISP_26719 [Willisornis vidua]
MAAPPGPRKRSGPALGGHGHGHGHGHDTAGAAPPGLRNGLPPHKRPKSAAPAAADPFGDSDEFTADDLEQIDILASQALSQDPPAGLAWGAPGLPRGGSEAGGRAEDELVREAFQFEVLQTQNEEIKQKLKEMQDEILTKNGEIKILRDSMQQMEFAIEEQKRSYLELEQQKSQTLSEKEKEFSKRLQSLQSELQFKDAEMNELRTRLQNCERNKHVTQAVPTTREFDGPNHFNQRRKCTQLPSSRTAQEDVAPLVSLQEAQKLAITGLNLIAMDEGLAEGSPREGQGGFLPLPRCRIRGAVHLLPLVEHHIGAYCRAGQLPDTSGNGSCGNHSDVSSSTSTSTMSSKEDFRLSLEETALISLGILYYLVFYSWDVVHTLLAAGVEKGSAAAGDEQVSKTDKKALCDNRCDNKEDTRTQGGLPAAPQDAPSNDRAQHSLFKKLLQVLAFSAARGSQTDRILSQSLKVLVKLAENSTMDLLIKLSQKDKLFHEHCLEVLHQYDQAMPGIRAILKKTQKLSACEELILDELYPPEPEEQGMDSS